MYSTVSLKMKQLEVYYVIIITILTDLFHFIIKLLQALPIMLHKKVNISSISNIICCITVVNVRLWITSHLLKLTGSYWHSLNRFKSGIVLKCIKSIFLIFFAVSCLRYILRTFPKLLASPTVAIPFTAHLWKGHFFSTHEGLNKKIHTITFTKIHIFCN